MSYHREADDGWLVDAELLTQSIAFAAAADAYHATYTADNWKVLQFLFGRSIELALKSYALHKGANRKFLMDKLRHDLDAALVHAESQGLDLRGLPDLARGCIRTLNIWYKRKDLEYPLLRPYVFPQHRIVRGAVDRIIGSVYVAVYGEAQYAADRPNIRGLSIGADY